MLTDQNIKLFKTLGLPIYDEDEDDKDVPFEELLEEKPKEEIYSLVREVAQTLQKMEAGPYTLYTFKATCNKYAREGASWQKYQALCCKYVEQQAYKLQRQKRSMPKPKSIERKSFDDEFWVY
jgi:dsDNA-specific endonuclease/ATPase MutS2